MRRAHQPSHVLRTAVYRDGCKSYVVQLSIDENALLALMSNRALLNKTGKATALQGSIHVEILK